MKYGALKITINPRGERGSGEFDCSGILKPQPV